MNIIFLNSYHYFNAVIMPRNPTLVQVGVFGVDHLERFRTLYPDSRIIAYEADLGNFKAMEKSLADIDAEFFNRALSNETRETTLYKYESNVAHSLFPRHLTGKQKPKLQGEVQVQGSTFEDMLENDTIERVDLLILNCEGAELFVLDALLDNPSLRDHVRQICVSFHAPRIYPMERKRKVIGRMEKHYHVVVKPHKVGIPDVLFIRR